MASSAGGGDDRGHQGTKRQLVLHLAPDTSDDDDEVQIIDPPAKRATPHPSTSTTNASSTSASSSSSLSSSSPARLPLLPWYLGNVRGLDNVVNEQCLRIEDVFSGEWNEALLCNYMYEMDWLTDTIPRLKAVPTLCVYGDNVTGQEAAGIESMKTFKPNLKQTGFPFGTHHSKMALLWFPTGVRVMITTANYIEIDWRNKTEGVWCQDYPFLPEGQADDRSEFGRDLRDYLIKLNGFAHDFSPRGGAGPPHGHDKRLLAKAIQETLPRVDFSTAQVVLLPSVPAKFGSRDDERNRYGYLKLQRYLENEPLPAETFWCPSSSSSSFSSSSDSSSSIVHAAGVISQFSSMGSHANDGEWVRDEFEPALCASATKSREARPLITHIVWPRMVDVRDSIEGWNAGGAMPCPPKNMFSNKPLSDNPTKNTMHNYLRRRICRWEATRWGRERAMPHFKSFLRYAVVDEAVLGAGGGGGGGGGGAMTQRQTTTRLGWVLITSHNFSKPAWGEMLRDRTLKIHSFELGVLFLPSRFTRFARTFSLTPDHPLLGLGAPPQEDIKGFYSASCLEAKQPRLGLLAMPIPYACPPPPYNIPEDVPWVSPLCNRYD